MSHAEDESGPEPIREDFVFKLRFSDQDGSNPVEFEISPACDVVHVFPGLGAAALKIWEPGDDETESTMHARWMDIDAAALLVEKTGLTPLVRPYMLTSEYEQYLDWQMGAGFDADEWESRVQPEPSESDPTT